MVSFEIPDGFEPMILNFLQGEDGKIKAIKLPPSWKKVSLAEATADD
ncbi:hypothetical protein [Pseudomonas sp. B1(2018)]|nr:hypothetical protein [Pseudomonas sp. B1(2018)]